MPEPTQRNSQIIALAVGLAAFADLAAAIWFFRKGQSS
jgi:hypothetical protein